MAKKTQKAKEFFYPQALTIAGSDSGGGAGIQADLRTFAAMGVYGASAITAVTVQNPTEVTDVIALEAEAVAAQIKAVLKTHKFGAVKTGMLHNAATIKAVAAELSDISFPIIVDPVAVATSGAKLLQDDAVDALKDLLLPLCSWVTPNIPEAEVLTGMSISTPEDMVKAAQVIAAEWDCGCVLKGGHLVNQVDEAVDVICFESKIFVLSSPFSENVDAGHGTGCTFSAAMAATLSVRMSWDEALMTAKAFVFGSLNEAVPLSQGIAAMYPPQHNYNETIALDEYEV